MEPDITQLASKVDTAFSAFEEFKGVAKTKLDKLDALDLEKLEKVGDVLADTVALKQRIDAIEVASKRPLLGKQEAKEENEEKQSKLFSSFVRAKSMTQMDFSDFAEQKAGEYGLELKDLSVGIDPDGGYLVAPTRFNGIIQGRVFETSPIRPYANVVSIGSDKYEFVFYDDQAESGGWVAETGTRGNTGTPQLKTGSIVTHEQFAQPQATQKILDDAYIDVEQWLAGQVADVIGRTENTAFLGGDGVAKPRGILTYSNYASAGVYEHGAIEQIVSGVAANISYNGLVDIQSSLKELYQGNARWMMKRTTFGLFLKLKDGDSTPIFNMMYDKSAGLATTIMGKPVVFADDMPAATSGSLSVLYADFGRLYTIVDRIGIRTLRDPYTNKPYVKYYTTKRVGGDVVNFEAGKILKLSAS